MTADLEELAEDSIRLVGGEKLREMAPEKIEVFRNMLHGSRRERRAAERELRKLGVQVIYGAAVRRPGLRAQA